MEECQRSLRSYRRKPSLLNSSFPAFSPSTTVYVGSLHVIIITMCELNKYFSVSYRTVKRFIGESREMVEVIEKMLERAG